MKKKIVAMMIMASALMAMSAQAETLEPHTLESVDPVGAHNCLQGVIEEGKCTYDIAAQFNRAINVNVPSDKVVQVTLIRGCDDASLTVTDQDYHQQVVWGRVTLKGNGIYVFNSRARDICTVVVEVVSK